MGPKLKPETIKSKCSPNNGWIGNSQFATEIPLWCHTVALLCHTLSICTLLSPRPIYRRDPRCHCACKWPSTERPVGTWHRDGYNDIRVHDNDVMASQITGVSIVCSTVCSGADQRKHQSSASLAFMRGIHRWPVNSPHKGPVTRRMFPFDDVIIYFLQRSPGCRCAHKGVHMIHVIIRIAHHRSSFSQHKTMVEKPTLIWNVN